MNAVRAEIGKLVTLPSLWITASLTLAVTLLLRVLGLPGSVLLHTQAGLLVFGVLATAHEYQGGGQIRTTLLATPRRLALAAAKTVALTLVALPVAGAAAVLAGEVPATPRVTLSMLVAAGVGGIVRQAVAAVGIVLTAYLIVVPLLAARVPASARWLPDTAWPAAFVWAVAMVAAWATVLRHRDANT
ncbi:hypothetical protein [Actinoplanes aureus]|uniref:Uncharacterized protein n=1 Tax=Actinoplanes aureus TaxID=2792083 RepID=A0A931C5L3_9ACTN|nr:hypothetical protein [Actinoplanes aureus]MBG0562654.1 hypothetical protein [Actinoplanes aureus]